MTSSSANSGRPCNCSRVLVDELADLKPGLRVFGDRLRLIAYGLLAKRARQVAGDIEIRRAEKLLRGVGQKALATGDRSSRAAGGGLERIIEVTDRFDRDPL